MLRLGLTVLAGLACGLAGLFGAMVLVHDRVPHDSPHRDALIMGGVFAGLAGGLAIGILGAARLTARWTDNAAAGASGLDIRNEGERTSTTEEMVRLVREPPASRTLPPAFLLVASFVLFLLVADDGASLTHLLVLVGVIAFHEAGHALAMRAFGYRDVRVFFIPFFGAATSGKPSTGPAWRHGVVLLLGPLPGLVLAVVLGAMAGDRTTTLHYTATMLMAVNAFNLVPVMPLDGGQLFSLILFGRHRVAELVARLLSAAAFAALAVSLELWVLLVVAYLQLAGASATFAMATASSAARGSGMPLPLRVEDASFEQVDAANRRWLAPPWGRKSVAARAAWIRQVLMRAIDAQRAPGLGGSMALVGGWLLSVVLAFVALAVSWRLE